MALFAGYTKEEADVNMLSTSKNTPALLYRIVSTDPSTLPASGAGGDEIPFTAHQASSDGHFAAVTAALGNTQTGYYLKSQSEFPVPGGIDYTKAKEGNDGFFG
mgnify:CR=1 FL=1